MYLRSVAGAKLLKLIYLRSVAGAKLLKLIYSYLRSVAGTKLEKLIYYNVGTSRPDIIIDRFQAVKTIVYICLAARLVLEGGWHLTYGQPVTDASHPAVDVVTEAETSCDKATRACDFISLLLRHLTHALQRATSSVLTAARSNAGHGKHQ